MANEGVIRYAVTTKALFFWPRTTHPVDRFLDEAITVPEGTLVTVTSDSGHFTMIFSPVGNHALVRSYHHNWRLDDARLASPLEALAAQAAD